MLPLVRLTDKPTGGYYPLSKINQLLIGHHFILFLRPVNKCSNLIDCHWCHLVSREGGISVRLLDFVLRGYFPEYQSGISHISASYRISSTCMWLV